MEIKFLEDIVEKHKKISHMASTSEVKTWTSKTISIMFPEYPAQQLHSIDKVQDCLKEQKEWLVKILRIMEKELIDKPESLAN